LGKVPVRVSKKLMEILKENESNIGKTAKTRTEMVEKI
jgi:hypothetical protein